MNTQKLRTDAKEIFNTGLQAAEPVKAVNNFMKLEAGDKLKINNKTYHLENFENVYIIGMGKTSALMTHAVEELLE